MHFINVCHTITAKFYYAVVVAFHFDFAASGEHFPLLEFSSVNKKLTKLRGIAVILDS